jgi:hypothetical protein
MYTAIRFPLVLKPFYKPSDFSGKKGGRFIFLLLYQSAVFGYETVRQERGSLTKWKKKNNDGETAF